MSQDDQDDFIVIANEDWSRIVGALPPGFNIPRPRRAFVVDSTEPLAAELVGSYASQLACWASGLMAAGANPRYMSYLLARADEANGMATQWEEEARAILAEVQAVLGD